MHVIGGKFKHRELRTPKGTKTRPTVAKLRQSFFDKMQTQIEGIRFLDLFAGSGAMGIEALSRGAEHVTFVEKNKFAVQCIKENLKNLGIEDRAEIFFKDVYVALDYLLKEKVLFDLAYVDPPYDYDVSFLLEPLASIMTSDGVIVVEQRKNTKLSCEFLQEVAKKEMGDTVLFFFTLKKND